MSDLMKKVEIPGIVWAILIIVIVAAVHSGEGYLTGTLGLQPWMIDVGLAMLIGILKGLSLGTGQLDQALNIIDRLMAYNARKSNEETAQIEAQMTTPGVGMRSAHVEITSTLMDSLELEDIASAIPERPNKTLQWLVG